MTDHEIRLFLLIGGFGLAMGTLCGAYGAMKGWRVQKGIGLSVGVAIVVPLVVGFIGTAIDAMAVKGHSIPHAVMAGLAAAFLLSFAVPILSGIPAALAALCVGLFARR